MKPTMRISMILVLFAFLSVSVLYAEQDTEKRPCFMDRDGDGIDDNARDLDDDGIPDQFGAQDEAEEEIDLGTMDSDMFSFEMGGELDGGLDGAQVDSEASNIPNSQKFAALQMSSRALSQHRSGLTSGEDFGPGVGALSGGVVCEGGVCRPR